jgi:hypothetical protein
MFDPRHGHGDAPGGSGRNCLEGVRLSGKWQPDPYGQPAYCGRLRPVDVVARGLCMSRSAVRPC